MSIDLLGLVKDQLTTAAVGKISGFLGESESGTTSALGAVLPTLLGSVMGKASTTEGATGLLGMLKNDNHDGGMLGGLGDMLGSGNGISSLLSGGSGIISSLLGDKVGGIVDLISNVSGIKKSSSSSLLSMAAPILMGVIGKQVSSQGLGVSGLVSMLMGQKDAVKAALPSGASSLLGMSGLGDFLGDAKSSVTGAANTVVNEVEEAATGGGFNFWPWLIGLGLLAGGWFFMNKCKSGDAGAAADSLATGMTAGIDSLTSSASSIVDSATTVVGDFSKKLASGIEIKGSSTGIESQLIEYIENKDAAIDKNKWFDFDNMLFDTGKSTLKAESQVQINNIVEIMKAYPSVKLKVGGYTDNVGNEASNMKLSTARAAAVTAAIIAGGVDKSRLEEAEGYGSAHPVASNDTDEGKAKNRRISASVRAK